MDRPQGGTPVDEDIPGQPEQTVKDKDAWLVQTAWLVKRHSYTEVFILLCHTLVNHPVESGLLE